MNSVTCAMRNPLLSIAAAFVALACGHSLRAADVPKPEKIVQQDPHFFVSAHVDRPDGIYREGDPLFLTVTCERDAHVYVLYKQADGKAFQIFPNSAQKDNRVQAKQAVQIPASDDQFRWRIGPPFGKELIKVIASKDSIENLDDPILHSQRFNPVSAKQVNDAAGKLQDEAPAKWAEDLVEITTQSKGEQVIKPQARRYGIFFGVSNYDFDEESKIASEAKGRKWHANLPCPANNANVLARLFKSMGKLDDLKICVNSEANKKNLEEAITQWLPSVSKPGDTVFIFFGGHGGELVSEEGDEEKAHVWLVVADYCDYGILQVLLEKQQAGTLKPALNNRVNELAEIARQAGSEPAAYEALIRHTGVVDDQFGHWIQCLAGRQVLVMLDTCHAGGFATSEKGELIPREPTDKDIAVFRFFDDQASRLKDIGQPESALLAACTAKQISYGLRPPDALIEKWRNEAKKGGASFDDQAFGNMAVFTYHVAEALTSLPPPTDVGQLHAHARDGMRQYFEKMNQLNRDNGKDVLTPHEALLFNYCTRPLIIKP
jgi:Domain of unknown function (DUF4384)/Caspase domain